MNVNALPIDPSDRYVFFTDLWNEPWTDENAEVVRYTLFHDPEPSICSLCPQILSSWGDTPGRSGCRHRICDTRNAFLRYIEAPLDFRVLNEVLTASGALGFGDDEMVNAIATHICSTEYCVPLNVIDALNQLNNPTPTVLDALERATTIPNSYYADEMIRRTAAETLSKLREKYR
ncbi:hypothetical protein NIES37_67170 [Tolypothrix tenuis PCC 7101]|uniref:Uncharacterized protein n=1 Tax=Tolypothrix tenuis PCC 7101 TaxID=231146 RepID=A0A1Z4NAF0_9CYAN|nr:hypothetical protein [Aulosira sp. FACHB-113]BAZ02704.1 hypothetical protein NIES37_67170 [Tolypothrix tenuis PCC 7101]BAZ78403.1 hypothetical protein NIES50_70360 [Aulosira laxa NIES-50]